MRVWLIAIMTALTASGSVAKPHKAHKAAATKPAAQAPAPRDVDGSWSIDWATSVGNCPTLIPSGLTIAEKKIASVSGADVASWGYVDEEGNIVARFTTKGDGEHVARFHGSLKAGKGSGAWSSSTDMCGGTWRAAQQ
jgi:hypothetical protein